MKLQQLRYVVKVAECGSITEASRRLFVSQPSITASIRELENEMGVHIFERTNKGVIVSEEIGNPPHHGTVAKLREVGIPVVAHRARQVRRAEYGNWDHIVYMDAENARGLRRIFGSDPDGKISRLLDWTERPGDVADPWYTGNFDATYRDVLAGCTAMLEQL